MVLALSLVWHMHHPATSDTTHIVTIEGLAWRPSIELSIKCTNQWNRGDCVSEWRHHTIYASHGVSSCSLTSHQLIQLSFLVTQLNCRQNKSILLTAWLIFQFMLMDITRRCYCVTSRRCGRWGCCISIGSLVFAFLFHFQLLFRFLDPFILFHTLEFVPATVKIRPIAARRGVKRLHQRLLTQLRRHEEGRGHRERENMWIEKWLGTVSTDLVLKRLFGPRWSRSFSAKWNERENSNEIEQ